MNEHVVIRYGILHQVVGPSTQGEGVVFVPVRFTFDQEPPLVDGEPVGGYRFRDYVGDSPPASLAQCPHQYEEVSENVWVRARFPDVFGFAPPSIIEKVGKYSLIEHVFLACRPIPDNDSWEAVPFLCLSSVVLFSPAGPEEKDQCSIADAFWQLFLERPDELTSFQDGYASMDLDDYYWSVVEYRDGKITEYEPAEWDSEDDIIW